MQFVVRGPSKLVGISFGYRKRRKLIAAHMV